MPGGAPCWATSAGRWAERELPETYLEEVSPRVKADTVPAKVIAYHPRQGLARLWA
ncbi:MAG: hypothetical protein ACK4Z6_07530 [Candidatus Methylomirabilales bacterium]